MNHREKRDFKFCFFRPKANSEEPKAALATSNTDIVETDCIFKIY
jgi:hypothetical protein